MEESRHSLWRGEQAWPATEVLIFAALAIFSLLVILFSHRVERWGLLVLRNLGVAVISLAALAFGRRRTSKDGRFVIRLASLLFLYAYLNLAADKLQLILHGQWFDDVVLRIEKSFFGVQPNLWMQGFVSKFLTEWMMFAYVVYLPLFPIVCGVIYRRRGESATEDYFLTLAIANVICDLGFILFPVAGPFFHIGSQFTVPLDGYVWTSIGEALRHHAQFVGGTIPSPHCANATVMLLMAYRYHRPAFWILSPIVFFMVVSTIYGRYHYVSDAILGVAVGAVSVALAPAFQIWWTRILRRAPRRLGSDIR